MRLTCVLVIFNFGLILANGELHISGSKGQLGGYVVIPDLPTDVIENKCGYNETCVPYYNCIDRSGAGIFNIRLVEDENDTKINPYVQCDSLRVCCEEGLITEKLPELEIPGECGLRNVDGLGFFAHGDVKDMAQFGEFPWMMAIMKKAKVDDEQVLLYMAGGSLIHPSVVLTTAHNLADTKKEELVIRAGEWNTQTTDEMLKHQERIPMSIVSHANFTRKNLQNDLALIFLEKPFEISPHINTICLPRPADTADKLTDQNCMVSGWGRANFGKKNSYQVFLKKVTVPYVPSDKCQSSLRGTRLGPDFNLHNGFMCAGGEVGVDACTGDGGSPLICSVGKSDQYFYQAGIVVGGIGCGQQNVPAFYADVQKYMPWIQEQAIAKGFST